MKVIKTPALLVLLFLLSNCSDQGNALVSQQCTMDPYENFGKVKCVFMNEGSIAGSICKSASLVRNKSDYKIDESGRPVISWNGIKDFNYWYVKRNGEWGLLYPERRINTNGKICSGILEPEEIVERSINFFFTLPGPSFGKNYSLTNFCNRKYDSSLRSIWKGCDWVLVDID